MIGKNVYQPSVRIGNWFEDIRLEESQVKDFLDKKENGDLLMQKRAAVIENILKKVELTVVNDGMVHFGDIIQLRCAGDEVPKITGKNRQTSVLAAHCSIDVMSQDAKLAHPCKVTSCRDLIPNVRSCFVITSCDGTPNGQPLRYTQPFYLKTTDGNGGNLFLQSDTFDFTKCAFRTRHQEVLLVPNPSYLAQWRIIYFNPLLRMEYENMPVPANIPVLINHVYTNQNLCVEDEARLIRTVFSMDYEVSVHTYLNSHKAEEEQNHWVIVTAAPGPPIVMHSLQKESVEEPQGDNIVQQPNEMICQESDIIKETEK